MSNHEVWATCQSCNLSFDLRMTDICDNCGAYYAKYTAKPVIKPVFPPPIKK